MITQVLFCQKNLRPIFYFPPKACFTYSKKILLILLDILLFKYIINFGPLWKYILVLAGLANLLKILQKFLKYWCACKLILSTYHFNAKHWLFFFFQGSSCNQQKPWVWQVQVWLHPCKIYCHGFKWKYCWVRDYNQTTK